MASVLDVPPSCFTLVSQYLEGDDVLHFRACCLVSKELIDEVSETIFENLLLSDFKMDLKGDADLTSLRVQPLLSGPSVFGTSGTDALVTCNTRLECWKQWRKANARYFDGSTMWSSTMLKMNGPYFIRAAQMWTKIEEWCRGSDYGTTLLATLNGGMSFQQHHGSQELKEKLTLQAYQSIASFYSSQIGSKSDETQRLVNLFGIKAAYNVLSGFAYNAHTITENAIETHVVVATSLFHQHLAIVVDAETGNLRMRDHTMTEKRCPDLGEESVLVWFEEYARRLQSNYYRVQVIIHGWEASALYPQSGPRLSRSVTCGVEVKASAVFAPELSQNGIRFIYSFRIRMLGPQEEGYDPSNTMCQLKSRHWRIADLTGRIDSVDGDGVVGRYPVLFPGGYRDDSGRSSQSVGKGRRCDETFYYQSCTSSPGTFGGFLTFVPGTLAEPTGQPFRVNVDPFPLCDAPEFLY